MWSALTILCLSCGSGFLQDSTTNSEFKERLSSIYRHSVKTVDVEELTAMMEQGAVVLDRRERDEDDVSHTRHAQQDRYSWLDMRDGHDIPKNDPLRGYGAVSNRSRRTAKNPQ